MLQDTRIDLFLKAECLQHCKPTTLTPSNGGFMGGIQDLGEAAVTELLLDRIDPFITRVERDRMVTWHLGVRL